MSTDTKSLEDKYSERSLKVPPRDTAVQPVQTYRYPEYDDKEEDPFDSNEDIPIDDLSGDENEEKLLKSSSIGSFDFLAKKNLERNNKKVKYKSLFATVQVMKTIVGTGILGLPYVIRNFGLVIGIGLFLVVYIANEYTCLLLLKAKNTTRHSNYQSIGIVAIGPVIKIIINIVVVLHNMGICMAELIIFGTTCQNVIDYAKHNSSDYVIKSPWYLTTWFLTLCVSVLMIPFAFVKSIEKLKYVSFIAISALVIFTVANFVGAAKQIQKQGLQSSAWPQDFDFLRSLAGFPTLLLAMDFQFNLFPIYKVIERPSDRRILLLCLYGLSGSLVLYLAVSITGYMSYGNTVDQNYLLSLKVDDLGGPLYLLLNITFVTSTTLSFPIIFYGYLHARQIRNKIFAKNESKLEEKLHRESNINFQKENDSEVKEIATRIGKSQYDPTLRGWKFYLVVGVFYYLMVTIAILVGDLGPIFNIVGAVGANAIAFLLPCTFYIRVTNKKNKHYFMAWVIIIIAGSVGLTCIIAQQIYDAKK